MPRRPNLDRPENLLPLRPLDFSILLVLARGEQYGYGLAKALAEEASGGIELAPGNLYQVLDRLLDWGLVRVTSRRPQPGAGGERRRHYAITGFGHEVAMLEAERLRGMLGSLDALAASPNRGD